MQYLDDLLGHARLGQDPHRPFARPRRYLRRFADHRVAREQCLHNGIEREGERDVPGRDHADDAERLVSDVQLLQWAEVAVQSLPVWSQVAAGAAGPVVDEVAGGHDFHAERLGVWLSGLRADGLGDISAPG